MNRILGWLAPAAVLAFSALLIFGGASQSTSPLAVLGCVAIAAVVAVVWIWAAHNANR